MKLIILDRDGVINEDSDHYIKSPAQWHILPRSAQAIACLKQHGYTVAVATNQSGIARGLYDRVTLDAIHEKMRKILAEAEAFVDYVVFCPHGPADHCDCRKPKPGLLRQIGRHFAVNLRGVPVVGDSLRDLQAADAVGARGLLVKTGKGLRSEAAMPVGRYPVFDDLFAVVEFLIQP